MSNGCCATLRRWVKRWLIFFAPSVLMSFSTYVCACTGVCVFAIARVEGENGRVERGRAEVGGEKGQSWMA